MHQVSRILNSDAPLQGTDEWLEWRKSKLTASDVHKIIGNAVKSRQSLLNEKCGITNRKFFGNEHTRAGHENEPIALEAYSKAYNVEVHSNLRPICHHTYPLFAASLDGVSEHGVNVEIKCLAAKKLAPKPKPIHVYQTHFQMACTGLSTTHLVYYYLNLDNFGNIVDLNTQAERAMQVHKIEFDQEWFNTHLPKFLAFVDDLQSLNATDGYQIDLNELLTIVGDDYCEIDMQEALKDYEWF